MLLFGDVEKVAASLDKESDGLKLTQFVPYRPLEGYEVVLMDEMIGQVISLTATGNKDMNCRSYESYERSIYTM